MRRIVPALDGATDGGPCFVWQSPLTAHRWHAHFPTGWRIVAACKLYPRRSDSDDRGRALSWDPVLFFSRRAKLERELPRDWDVADLRSSDGYRGDNVHPCPRPLSHVRFLVENVRAESTLDPFMGSGTTGVAAVLAGKRFVGIERNPVYFECAVRRIRDAHARAR
jgi:DNA modification methylase